MAARDDASAEGPADALTADAVVGDETGGGRPPVRRSRLPDGVAVVAPTDETHPTIPSGDSGTIDVPLVAADAPAPQAPLSPAERALITLLVELALKPWTPGT